MGSKGGSSSPTPPAPGTPITDSGRQYLLNNPDVANDPVYGRDPWRHYNERGKSGTENRLWPGSPEDIAANGGGADTLQSQLDAALSSLATQGESSAQAARDYAHQVSAQREEDRLTAGQNERDALYTEYINSANSATDFVNSAINSERSNAALLGISYAITDEQKATRISDQFSTIWGEGDQSRIESMFTEFGNPEGFEEFTITRGDGGDATEAGPSGPTSLSSSGGLKPKTGSGGGVPVSDGLLPKNPRGINSPFGKLGA